MIMLRASILRVKFRERSVADWKTLVFRSDAEYDKVIILLMFPELWHYGYIEQPEMGVEFDQPFPETKDFNDENVPTVYGR